WQPEFTDKTLSRKPGAVHTDFASWQQATRVTLGRCPQGLFTDCRTGWEIDPVA
ncbi:hypothetical protein, partial [Shigella flexneri]|uniref:hypothetical protein n=1 Tax=Shigella flexneri TaxID=623 RepID=UPI001F4E8851